MARVNSNGVKQSSRPRRKSSLDDKIAGKSPLVFANARTAELDSIFFFFFSFFSSFFSAPVAVYQRADELWKFIRWKKNLSRVFARDISALWISFAMKICRCLARKPSRPGLLLDRDRDVLLALGFTVVWKMISAGPARERFDSTLQVRGGCKFLRKIVLRVFLKTCS